YDLFLTGDIRPWTYADLNMPDGSRIHFVRTSPHSAGDTDASTAVYQTTANTAFYGAQIVWNGNGWTMTQKDGSVWTFREGFAATLPTQGAVLSMADRYGNTVTMTRDQATGNLLKVMSPNGRWISFTYDTSNRVTQATDNSGRSYTYTYDSGGRLASVTDPMM